MSFDYEWRDIETAPDVGMYLVSNELGEVCPVAMDEHGNRIILKRNGYNGWTDGHPAVVWTPLPRREVSRAAKRANLTVVPTSR